MPGATLRDLLGNPRVWSGLTVLLELSRALSYMVRPPVVSGPIENLLPYSTWALVLLCSALLITAGSAFCRLARAALLGHMVGVFCYVTFGSSILLDALLNGAAWASMGSLYVVGVLHFGLTVSVGERLARYRREREAAQHER